MSTTKYPGYSDCPEGWHYDGPDYSVGIFGEDWWHSDCLSDDGQPCRVEDEQIGYHGFGASRTAIIQRTLFCLDCGQSVSWQYHDWDPEDEEDTRDFVPYADGLERDPYTGEEA